MRLKKLNSLLLLSSTILVGTYANAQTARCENVGTNVICSSKFNGYRCTASSVRGVVCGNVGRTNESYEPSKGKYYKESAQIRAEKEAKVKAEVEFELCRQVVTAMVRARGEVLHSRHFKKHCGSF